jgi:transposase
MSKAQLVITAVVLEGRSKSEVARDYGLSRYWVHQLASRYHTDGAAAFEPRSRRPHHHRYAVSARSKTGSCGCASRCPTRLRRSSIAVF